MAPYFDKSILKGATDLGGTYGDIQDQRASYWEDLGDAPWFNINDKQEYLRVNQELESLEGLHTYFPLC